MHLLIEAYYINRLEYFGLDLFLLVGKLQRDLRFFRFGWSLIQLSALDW